MFKEGDEVIINKPHWHEGVDIGGRLAKIISISGYIMVNIYDYSSNPVKCFRNEISKIKYNENYGYNDDEDDANNWFNNLFQH